MHGSPSITPWWKPESHQDRRPFLLARARIKHAIRDWFMQKGFVEVDCAHLQVSPGNETHIHAFKTEQIAPDQRTRELYLHTSPEFACKKLLAAGETKIFTFAQVFRNREFGRLHQPEFTMLEWYEADVPYERLMEHCAEIIRTAATHTGHTAWSHDGRECDAMRSPARVTVTQAFKDHAGIDLMRTHQNGTTDRAELAAQARAQGIRVAEDDTWSDIFSRILVERIEPNLGIGHTTLLDAYPLAEAALACASRTDPGQAERFELYACGVELANGFGELTDGAIQRARFQEEMDAKEQIYGERYPIDEDFIAALDDMPQASGCALGFDRLVMLATGAQRVDQVMWTPMLAP